MTFQKRFPKLYARLEAQGISQAASAGYLLDDLNYVLTPIGFRVIEEHEVIEASLQDAERFLERLDKK